MNLTQPDSVLATIGAATSMKNPVGFRFQPGKPFQILPEIPQDQTLPIIGRAPSSSELAELEQIAGALKAYHACLRELLADTGRFAMFRNLVWSHLKERCNVMILGSAQGVIIRHDIAEPVATESMYVKSWSEKPLAESLAFISEQVIHVREANTLTPTGGLLLQVMEHDPAKPEAPDKVVSSAQFFLETTLEKDVYSDPLRPDRLMFALNVIEGSVVFKVDSESGQIPVAELPLPTFPVGWSAIEVYRRPATPDAWLESVAAARADRDILQSVASAHLLQEDSRRADVIGATREAATRLLREFEQSLPGAEEQIHTFLKAHPQLISATYKRSWSKLPLGNRLVTDFVLQEASGDYLFVELERADHQLFRADGQQAERVTHAINQVQDWFRYVQDNRDTLVRELGLDGLSTSPKGLVVIGRSKSLSDENRRKLRTIAELHPRLIVVTYDDLLHSARVAFANLFGRLEGSSQQTRQVGPILR